MELRKEIDSMTEAQRDIYLLLLLTGREDEATEARRKWEEQKEWGGQENHTVKNANI